MAEPNPILKQRVLVGDEAWTVEELVLAATAECRCYTCGKHRASRFDPTFWRRLRWILDTFPARRWGGRATQIAALAEAYGISPRTVYRRYVHMEQILAALEEGARFSELEASA